MPSAKISIHDITFKLTFYQIKYANLLTNSSLKNIYYMYYYILWNLINIFLYNFLLQF